MKPGLYYPYIRVRDINWLKGTLIVFPHIFRMVPACYSPWDQADDSLEFTQVRRGDHPLLREADLLADRVMRAQERLTTQLATDALDPTFLHKYSKSETLMQKKAKDPGVQLHRYKFDNRLISTLENAGLCWKPDDDVSDGDHYVEVHPSVGEAIMSTVAIACAQAHDTSVVSDRSQGDLHRCLLTKDIDSVYTAWLHPSTHMDAPNAQTGTAVYDVIIKLHCDVSGLTATDIARLGDDRIAIDALLAAIEKDASEIRLDPGSERDKQLKDLAADILTKWESERRNMSRFARRVVGGLPTSTADFAKKVVEKTFAPPPALGGALVGGLTIPSIWGILAGFAIGLVPTYIDVRNSCRDSPLRFLTAMEKSGVNIKVPMQIKGEYDSDYSASHQT